MALKAQERAFTKHFLLFKMYFLLSREKQIMYFALKWKEREGAPTKCAWNSKKGPKSALKIDPNFAPKSKKGAEEEVVVVGD